MDTTESEDYLQAFLAGDFGFNPSTESGDFLRSHERDKLAAARDIALKNARRAYASLRAQLQSADAVRRLEVEEARHERDSLWQDKFRITEAQCEKVKRELQLRNVMNAELTSENIEFLGDKRRRSEELWAAAAPVAKHAYYKDEKSLLRGLRQALDERQKPNLEASGTEAAPWRNVIKEHGELQKQCADMQRRYEEEKMEKQTALDTLEKNAAELHDVRETVGELTREITNHDDAWGLMLKLADTEMEELRDKLAVHETHKQELRSEVAQLRVPTAHSTDTHPDERAPSSSSHFSHEAPHTALVLPSEKTLRASHDSLRNLRSPRNLQPPQAAARGGSASSHRSAASVGSHRSAWSFALSPRATEKDVPWEQSLRSPIGSSRASSVSCKGKDRARSHSSPRALRPSDVSQRSSRSHSPSRRKLLGSERPTALAGQKRPSSKAAVRPSIARKTGESPRSSDPQVMQRQWAKHHRALSRLREQEQTRRTIIATLTVEEKRLRAEIDSLTNIHAASVGDVTEVLRIQMWELEQRQRAAQANGVGGQEEGHEAQLQLRAEIAFLKADNARLTERAISVEGDTEARARAARADNTLGRKDTLAVRTAPLANGGRCESVQRYEVMLEKQNAALRRDKSALVGHLQRLHVAHDAHLCENGHMVNEEHDEDNNRRAALQRANAQLKMDKDTLLWTLCAQAHGALEEDHGMAHESLQEEMQAILAVLQDNERLTHEVQELRTKMQVQEQVIEERRDAGATPQGGVVQRGSDPAGPTRPQDALQLHALQMENETLKAENERLSSRSTHKVGTGASSVEARTKKGENNSSLRREIACLKDNKAELLRTHNALETAMEEHRMHDMLERTTQEEVLEYKGHRICVLTKQISALKEENKRLTTSSGVDLPWLTEMEEPHNQQCISALRKENDRLRAENEDLVHSHSVVRQAMEEHRVHDVVERVKQEELVVVEQMRITQLTKEIAAVKEEYDGLLKRQEQDVTRDEECIAALRDANARLTTDFSTQLREAHAAMEEYRMEYVVEHEKAACEAEARADALLHKKEVHLAALAADVAQLKEGRATALGREMPQHDGDRTDVVGWWKARDKERMGALQEENGGAVEDNGGLVAERRQSDDEDAQCGTDDAERVTQCRLTTDGAFGHQQERDHAAAELRWDNRHLRRRNSMLVQKLHQNNVGIVGQLLRNSAEYDDEPMKNVDGNDPHFGALMRENTKLQDQNEELERMVQDINVPLAEESQIGDDEDHPELQRVSVLESENTWLRKEAQKWKRELASGRHGAPNGAEGASAQIRVEEEVGGITPLMQEVQAIKDEKEGLEKFVASQRSSVAQQIVAGIEAQKKAKKEERRIAALTNEVETLKADKEALENNLNWQSTAMQEYFSHGTIDDIEARDRFEAEERRITELTKTVVARSAKKEDLEKMLQLQRMASQEPPVHVYVEDTETRTQLEEEERRITVLKKEVHTLTAEKESTENALKQQCSLVARHIADGIDAQTKVKKETRRITALVKEVDALKADKEKLEAEIESHNAAPPEPFVHDAVRDIHSSPMFEEEERRIDVLKKEVHALTEDKEGIEKALKQQRSSVAQNIADGIETQKKAKTEERRIAALAKEVEALNADKEALEQKGDGHISIALEDLARESPCDEEESRSAVLTGEVQTLRSEKERFEKSLKQVRSSVAQDIGARIEAQKKVKEEERRIAALIKEVEALTENKDMLEKELERYSVTAHRHVGSGVLDDGEMENTGEGKEHRVNELTREIVLLKEDKEQLLQRQSHSEDEYLANHAQTAWEATQLVTALNLKNKELEVEISELCDIHSAFVAITRDRELKGWLLVHELQHNNDGRDAAIAAAARDRARGEVDNEAQRGITVVMKEEHRKELPKQVEGPMFEQAPSAQDATVCALQEEISGLKLRLRSSEDLYENMAAECARIEARAQQVMQLENTAAVAHATFHKHASKQLNEVLPHATLQQDVVDDYVGRHIEESFPIIACLEQTARAREEGMETLEATKDSVSQPNEESGTRIPEWARDMTDQHATMTRAGESIEVSQRCANESTQRTADGGSLEQQTADRDDALTTLTEEKTGLERHHNTRSRRLDLLEQQTLHQSEVIAVLDEDKNAYMQRYEARRECVERVEQEALAHRGDTLLVPEEGLAPQRSAPEHASRIGALTHDAAQWTTKSADLRSECNAHLARIRSLEERNTALQAENTAYVAVYPDCMTAQAALDQLRASIQSTTLENNVATQRLEATQAAYKDEEHKIRALCTRLGEDAIGAERHLVRAREQVAREEHALEGVSAQVTEERQARAMCESMVCELRAMVDDEKRSLVVAELALQAMNADIEAARRVRGQEETIVRELQNANDDLQSVEGRLRKDEYGLEESVGVLTKALAATNCEIADQRASLDHLRATVRDEEASGAELRASSALLDTTVRASEHHVQELHAQARAAQQCGEREKEKYDALQKCEEGKLATLRHEVVALEQEVEVSRATYEASRATRALAIAELEETEQVHQDTITRLKQQQMALIQDQSLLRTMVAQLRKEEHMCETQIHDVHRAQQCETNEVTAAKHAVAECAAELDAMKHEEISVRDELTTVRAGVARYKQEQHALLDARALLASESAALASEHAHLHEDVARVRAVELPTVQGELRAMHDELATQRLALLHVTREETSAAESLQRLHTNVDALEQHKTALLVAVKGHTQGDALWTPSGMGVSTMHTREDDDVADAKKIGQGRDVHEGTGVGVDEDGHAVVGTWGRDEPFEARRRNEGEVGGLKEEEQWLEDRVRSLRTEEEECQHEVYLRTEEAARESHEMEELSDSIEEMKQEENWRASVLMDLKREELRLCKSVEKLKQEEVRLSTPWASLDTDHTPGVNVAALPISEESSQVAHHDAEGEEGEWRQRALQAADENVSLSTDVAELREQNEKKRNEVNAQAELIESMRLHREHLEREIHLLEQRLHDRGSPSGAPGMPGVIGLGGAPCLASSENGDERAADSGSGDRDGDQGGPQNVEELEKKLRVAEKEVRCEREERRQTDRFYEHLNEKMLKLSSIILVNEQLLDKHQCVVTEDSKRTCDIYKTQAKLARQETR
eukprot:GEMP01000094.1.p1 GENE.GEMP01000094.1~~GEMP01000094.1.p1  ORF type:complete len:3102 (+),score=1101.42 GEMP01000094.1:269-9574(+)